MREYAKVSPKFWIGPTGRGLRKIGLEAQAIAFYLLTSPHSNMLGMYYLPLAYIANNLGIPFEGASKGVRSLQAAGFCAYDEETEVVWVYQMASSQIGEELKPKDNLVEGIRREYGNLPDNPFLLEFYQKYHAVFHMQEPRGLEASSETLRRPSEAPSKVLRSKEIETDIETEIEKQEKEKNVEKPCSEPTVGQFLETSTELPDWLPANAWEALLAHRKSVKSPMTLQAQQLAIAELAKFQAQGDDPAEVINQTILNGWKGVFALRKPPAARNGKFDPVAWVNRNRISDREGDVYDTEPTVGRYNNLINFTNQSVA